MRTLSNIPKEEQITYAIHINAKTPYEIFIDDIPLPGLGRHYSSGMNTTLELNPYLLSNGLHKLKVRYLPLETAKDSLLHPGDVYHNEDAKWNVFFVRYIKNVNDPLGYEGEIDYGNSELEVIAPPKPVPFWEQVFELDIRDLPFEQEGWKYSIDLKEMDEDELENEVFAFFEELRKVMNDGDFNTYLEMTRNRDFDIAQATYDSDMEWFSAKEQKDEFIATCKGKMLPVDKELYRLSLYANGKLATIERIDKFKNKALLAKRERGYAAFTFKIHKPSREENFEIIRK